MGIISLEKSDRLYWLGRYTERVFTTLSVFFEYYDTMIDSDPEAYREVCRQLSIPDVYGSREVFNWKYLFDEGDMNSIYSNLDRAFNNGVALRDELSTTSLSYIQMALDTMKRCGVSNHQHPLLDLQEVIDDLYAFWGSVDDCVEDQECRNIMKTGRYTERLDLYIRLDMDFKLIEKEFMKLRNRITKVQLPYDEMALERIAEMILREKENWKDNRYVALELLETVL